MRFTHIDVTYESHIQKFKTAHAEQSIFLGYTYELILDQISKEQIFRFISAPFILKATLLTLFKLLH